MRNRSSQMMDMGAMREELDDIDQRERAVQDLCEYVANCYLQRVSIAIDRFPSSSTDRQVAMAWCPYHEFADRLRKHMRDHHANVVVDHVRLFGYVDYIYGCGVARGRCQLGQPPDFLRLAQ